MQTKAVYMKIWCGMQTECKRPAKPIAVRVFVELAGFEPASGQAIKMLSTCLAVSLIFVREQGSNTQHESYPLECLCFYGALEQIASDL